LVIQAFLVVDAIIHHLMTVFLLAPMSSRKTFYYRFSHFLLGMVSVQMLGLITFPILTRILTKEEYGILGLVTTTMLFAVAVAKAGLSDAIVRFYKECSEVPEKLVVFSSTVIMRGVVFALVTALIYVMVFPSINRGLRINEKYIVSFMIMGIYLFVRPLNIIVLNILKVRGKTILLNVINLIEKAISIALSLLLLTLIFHNIYGYFIGVIISELIISIVLFYWFFVNYKVVPSVVSKELTLKLIKFGCPLLVSELCFLLLSYADRFMIVAYYGEAAVGLYSVGYNLAMYIANILVSSISYAIVPMYVEIYESEGKERTEEFLKTCTHYIFVLIIPLCFGYFAISKDLIITLASEKYAAAATFSPIILVASFLIAMNTVFNAGLYLQKKTGVILQIMLVGIIVNIGMNLFLLPKFGLMGAAVATLGAGLITTISTVALSYRYISIPVDAKGILYYFVLSVIMFFVLSNIEITMVVWNVILKFILGCSIISIGLLYREKEIVSWLRKRYLSGNIGL
jgi:O-antigen/teichoic acid export membrane protein